MRPTVSIIIPARNEATAIVSVIERLKSLLPDAELLVVNDGSTDNTADVSAAAGATVITHPYSMGNGAAIKTGARQASGDVIVFMDADGQHRPEDVPRLLARLETGFDMVVGARGAGSQASVGRSIANRIYNRMGSWMTGQNILDLTSGFRAVRTNKFREFLHLLPNRFSYPTTITMSFFRAGYLVCYEPIDAPKRIGQSHIRPIQDGLRFLMIIFKVGTLYSPLKLFLPISATFFFTALGYYLFTYFSWGRFTNMSALLFSTSVIIFLIGLVSEQITTLIYSNTGRDSTGQ